jgi:hypothetical protein
LDGVSKKAARIHDAARRRGGGVAGRGTRAAGEAAGSGLRFVRRTRSHAASVLPWAYDPSINFLDPADVMRARYQTAGFRILESVNYSNVVIKHYEKMLSSPPKLTNRLIFGDDAPERQRNLQRNLIEGRTIYWMITVERPRL